MSDEPATVVGFSSGALVALTVLIHHPSVVRTLVPFEPPAVRQLPDGQKWVNFFFEIYNLYRQSGMQPALDKFRGQAFAESDRQAMARARDPKNSEYILANANYGSNTSCANIRRSTLALTRFKRMPIGSCWWPGGNRVAIHAMR